MLGDRTDPAAGSDDDVLTDITCSRGSLDGANVRSPLALALALPLRGTGKR